MKRVAAAIYGVLAYLAFFATILYTIGFLGNFVVPKSIDSGRETSAASAIAVNALLMLLFALQHSIMARRWFKVRWTKIVPKPIERSTFVLITSALLAFIFWQWRPIGTMVWEFENPVARAILHSLFFLGWVLVFSSTFLIDHFDLFGLRQVYLYLTKIPYTHPKLKTDSLYKYIRHPIMLGFLVAVWATPRMTAGHLLFSILLTAYTFVGIALEERDLKDILGVEYRRYRDETPMLLPLRKRGRAGVSPGDRPVS